MARQDQAVSHTVVGYESPTRVLSFARGAVWLPQGNSRCSLGGFDFGLIIRDPEEKVPLLATTRCMSQNSEFAVQHSTCPPVKS